MITLINPPNPPNAVSNKDTMGGFGQLYEGSNTAKIPPLDLPYTAAVIRKAGLPVTVIDCLASDYGRSQLIDLLRADPAEITAIRTSTSTLNWDLEVARAIKGEIDTKMVFFGPHVMVSPQDVVADASVDAIVIG